MNYSAIELLRIPACYLKVKWLEIALAFLGRVAYNIITLFYFMVYGLLVKFGWVTAVLFMKRRIC